MIRGRFTVDGEPVEGEDVLVLGGDPPRLRAAVATGPGGAFEAELPAEGPVVLVGRASRDGLAVASADGGDPVELDARGPLHALAVEIHSDDGYPERLQLFLDPLEVDGVPAERLPFAWGVEPGVFNARFWEQEVTGRRVELRVQAGSWRIGALFVDDERPMMPAPDFKNYVAQRAVADGGELPASGSGFAIEVRGDRAVRLDLRELRDDEL